MKNSPNQSQIDILIIEDDKNFSDLVEMFFDYLSSNVRVEKIQDPLNALNTLFRNPKQYDIIICDYNMPNLSGLDVWKRLQAENITLPFIILTGCEKSEILLKIIQEEIPVYFKGLDFESRCKSMLKQVDSVTRKPLQWRNSQNPSVGPQIAINLI